jgi:hypothetical protein
MGDTPFFFGIVVQHARLLLTWHRLRSTTGVGVRALRSNPTTLPSQELLGHFLVRKIASGGTFRCQPRVSFFSPNR